MVVWCHQRLPRRMEILPGIHRIESDLWEQRTVLVDTGLAGTPEEVIVPYLEEIGLGVGDVDEVIVSHADVAHFGLLGPNG